MSSLDQLIPILDEQGYFRHYLSLGEGNLRTWDWKLFANKLQGPSKLCWRFFLLGSRIQRASLDEVIPPAITDQLISLGLASEKKEKVSLGKTVLIHCLGKPIFIDLREPSLSRLGDDVVAVASQVPNSSDFRNVLCLNSLGGGETLNFVGRRVKRMTVVAPTLAQPFVQANWELNGGNRALKLADSIDGIRTGTEDLILARIPSLPVPEAFQHLDIDAGTGADGADPIRQTLKLASDRLTDDGFMGFAALMAGGEKPGKVVTKFRKMVDEAGLSASAEFLSRQRLEPGVTLFNQAIYLAEKSTRRNVRELMDEFMAFYGKADFPYVYFLKGIVRRPSEDGRPQHRLIELTDRYFGTWTV